MNLCSAPGRSWRQQASDTPKTACWRVQMLSDVVLESGCSCWSVVLNWLPLCHGGPFIPNIPVVTHCSRCHGDGCNSVSYVREICTKEDWSPYVNVTRHSRVKHLAMSATKIVLEWTKAVTFIVTITFVLLALGLEQGLEHYKPTALYTAITGTYYLLTERTFLELWPIGLSALKLERLEGMELLYFGVWARAITTVLALPLVPALIWYERWRLSALLFYVCVFVHGRHRLGEALMKLQEARGSLARFRRATTDELATLEDVCAVCLGTMKSARVTPCAHFFHADCLRKCLANSDRCPICVRPYVFCWRTAIYIRIRLLNNEIKLRHFQ